MRIAMFTNNYKPYIGGVPVSIEHLAAALREQGNIVYVFAPSYKNQVEEEYVIRYPSFPITIEGAPIPNILTRLFSKKMEELSIDVIHVHHPAIVGNIALSMKKKYGIPVVFTYHTRYEEYLHYVKPLEKMEDYTSFVEHYLKYFCNKCDLIVAPTPGMKDYLMTREIDTPIGVLPTGLQLNSFYPDEEKAAQIRAEQKKDADYLFCTVARLAKEKNLDFQLEGLKILKDQLMKKRKTFRMMFIGEGSEREAMECKIRELGMEENIVLIGNVQNHEIAAYQKAADLFLFSSKSETQGIVIIEAMAAGNPVVAIKATGVEDIVEDGKNGFLTAEDKEEWVKKIMFLLENHEAYQQMSEEAFATASAYSESKIAQRAENYYFNLLCNRERVRETVFFRRSNVLYSK